MIKKSTVTKAFVTLCLLIYINIITSYAQQQYKIALAAFYNCENFYDTLDNENVRDEEFLPAGIRHYNTTVYQQKVAGIARVLAGMGTDKSADGPALIGLAEIENKCVLEDLVQHPLLQQRQYGIIHYNSHDARGVDVALLYNPVYFQPDTSASLPVLIKGAAAYARLKQADEGPLDTARSYHYYSRDILWIKGRLDGEVVHIYVNHWPSRLGGETRTTSARQTAALICKRHWDSVCVRTPGTKALIMGDFNDDPVSQSISHSLKASGRADTALPAGLYNPWLAQYKKGNGTLAYRDAWGLFDQIITSNNWLRKQQAGFMFHAAYIYKPDFMVEQQGRYTGYPMRFWEGTEVRGGFSDHFPVYIALLKQVKSSVTDGVAVSAAIADPDLSAPE